VPPFIDHLFSKINQHIQKGGRILILTLTKRSAEEITNFFVSRGYKAYYLHSEIDTIDRWEIIKKLKSGEIDILIGVNLLREGIDLPEVTFIAILDADKE
jgi:excinuclease ABC subunit B